MVYESIKKTKRKITTTATKEEKKRKRKNFSVTVISSVKRQEGIWAQEGHSGKQGYW